MRPTQPDDTPTHKSVVASLGSSTGSSPRPNYGGSSSTGIATLDRILGGGFPKNSIILLAGPSGSGKTIFSLQWLFQGIAEGERGIYITLTEPLFKSLKDLETMSFYHRDFIESEQLKIVDARSLASIYEHGEFNAKQFLAFIEAEVRRNNAKRFCIDSVTAIAYSLGDKEKIRSFIFELGKILATLGCTTMLTSEVTEAGKLSIYAVEEFISDVAIRLNMVKVDDEAQRVLEIVKVRGRGFVSEDLYFKILSQGITVFPKLKVELKATATQEKVSLGITALDGLLRGGVFKGSSTLVSGATGTGKSVMGIQFLMDGLRRGENCLLLSFEESPDQVLRNAKSLGIDFQSYLDQKKLLIRANYPSEKYLEEHLSEITNIINQQNIQRCTIDSVSALTHTFPRQAFFSFIKRLNAYLKLKGVTALYTHEAASIIGSIAITESRISTMYDNIILLRFVEIQGDLRRILNIIKVRGSGHSKGLREFDVTSKGIVIGPAMIGYEGVITGVTRKVSATIEEQLQSNFSEYLGPIGHAELDRLKETGELSLSAVLSFVDSLIDEGTLNAEAGKKMKQEITHIFGRTMLEEPSLEKSALQDIGTTKASRSQTEKSSKTSEKNTTASRQSYRSSRRGFFHDLFGGDKSGGAQSGKRKAFRKAASRKPRPKRRRSHK